jgi:DNA-binding NtrC family response regulator
VSNEILYTFYTFIVYFLYNCKMEEGKVLIIDDNEGILKSLQYALKFEFTTVRTTRTPNQIPSLLQAEKFDVILLDMNFSAGVTTGNEGIFWLREILKLDPEAVVILITAYGDVGLAVRAIREGAVDFIIKPWDPEKLISTLKAAYKLSLSKKEVIKLKRAQVHLQEDISREFGPIIGESNKFRQTMDLVMKAAPTEANVLILGENGTGKELLAREIHRYSRRSEEVFISVDMSSLSESLIESELFGHKKGAFTDAREDRVGRFESASGGTLFLDEIGNIPTSVQAKLLTVLQNRIIYRVGSNQPIPVDIRLITATNKSIRSLVADNYFRQDLYYRINTIQIQLPPLREREQDILLLAEHFLQFYRKKYAKPLLKINSAAMDKLNSYHWPGNIRELRHTIEKAVILSEGNTLKPSDFLFSVEEATSKEPDTLNLEEVERTTIMKALKKHRGNLSKTANELGITRKTLYSKIEKYGL